MKTRRIFSMVLAPIVVMALTINCSDDEGVTHSLNDVSSSITGFSSDITGAGASLTINGSNLDKVVRVCMEQFCVASRLFTAVSESSLTFNVPLAVPLGENDLLIVFTGSDRAFATIEVVALQAISSFVPYSAATGETVTLFGTNFSIVTAVNLGGVPATITSQSANQIAFTVPAGITNGKITLVSAAGNTNSTADLISCTANPTASDCSAGLNLNSGFELGAGDVFTNWNKFNGAGFMLATTSVTGNEVFRGTRALKVIRDGTVVPATDQWRIQLASDFVTTGNGTSYTVFAWVRASAPGGAFRFSNQDAAQYGPDTAIPITWTRISWTFTSNATQKRIVLDMNGAAVTTFFIDDVKLIQN